MTELKAPEIAELRKTLDSWVNILTGLGVAGRDKRLYTQAEAPDVLSQQRLSNLFRGSFIARRICELPSKDSFREWFRVGEEANNDELQSALEELGAKAKLIEAVTWARLYGGSVVLLGLDDGQDPVQPLKEDRIKAFSWMTVLTRYDVIPERWYNSLDEPRYGEVELYRIQPVSRMTASTAVQWPVMHESRILRFDGPLTPPEGRQLNQGWNDSVFTGIIDYLRANEHVWSAAEILVTDFSQAIYRMKGLAEAISSGGEDLVKERMQLVDLSRSVLRAVLLDEAEGFERTTTNLTGLPELLDRFMSNLASAAGMPVTLLFGRSPAGMNSTGESDLRNWYDLVANDRALYLENKIERLVKLMYLAKAGPTNGREPEDWHLDWNPLWQETQGEKLTNRKSQMEIDTGYINAQVLDPDEVADSRFGGSEYSFETELDLDARDATGGPAGGEPDGEMLPGQDVAQQTQMPPEMLAQQERMRAAAQAAKTTQVEHEGEAQ